jgi:predicted KAP-like P-loop ATPase
MLFHDEPISSRSDDLLNRRRFVTQLSRAILSWNTNEPLVVGIYAGWGDGKTSVLNLLNEELSGKASVMVFDPWYFNSQEELVRIFFQDVFGVVSRQLSWISG